MNKSENLVVSDLFIEIYKNFNVFNQVQNMKSLSKKELYLLLTVCIDNFSEDDPVAKINLESFSTELIDIFNLQDDKDVPFELAEIANETGDKYLETDNIIDSLGNNLPKPLNKQEVRDAKINILNKD